MTIILKEWLLKNTEYLAKDNNDWSEVEEYIKRKKLVELFAKFRHQDMFIEALYKAFKGEDSE